MSIGIALANRLDGKKNRVYTLIGDGESNEGQIWEAAMAAPKFKLHNLVAILDRNRIQQDGFTEDIMPLDPTRDKWSAFNWNVIEISGHNVEQIIDALNKASEAKDSPTIIIANTIKGNGIKHMTNNPQWHGKAPPREHTPLLLEELGSECLIAPSIIAGQQENYEEKIRSAERGGADIIHLDIMDGRFVPNTTFYSDTIKQLRLITTLPFDAHLMIDNPLAHIQEYIDARCDIVTVHAEACTESEFAQITDRLLSNGISPRYCTKSVYGSSKLAFSPFTGGRSRANNVRKPGFCRPKIHPRSPCKNPDNKSKAKRTRIPRVYSSRWWH